MAPLHSFSFSFDKADRFGLVEKFYQACSGDDIAFIEVEAWGCRPDLTIAEIIQWNQKKLSDDYVLGPTTHVRHNYRSTVWIVGLKCSVKFMSITDEFEAMFRIEQFIADRIAGWLLFLQCDQGDDNALAKVMQSPSWLQRKIAAYSTSRAALNLLLSPSLHEQTRDLAANRLIAIAN
jgi:hypothetical protein